jgi:predicted transcriptional regulator YdeE
MTQHLHITNSQALVLAGRQGRFAVGPSEGIKALWLALMEDFGKIEGQIGTKAYGVCHNFSGDATRRSGEMDYLAAAQVHNAGAVPGYMKTLIIPARREAILTSDEGVGGLSAAWRMLFDSLLPKAGAVVVPGPQYEAYDFGSHAEQNIISIHVPVA